MSKIKYPFGLKEVLRVSPSQTNVVNLEIDEPTFVEVTKLGANTTINVTASVYLDVGTMLVIRTFNINGETFNTEFGDGFFGDDISGVSNKAHNASFMFDGTRFVQIGTQVLKRDELETISASMAVTIDGNEVTVVTTYENAAAAPDEWVVDAKLTLSKPAPVGATLAITGLTGNYEVEDNPQSVFWLSDIIEAHIEEIPTRTKLNGHTTQSFILTVGGLTEKFETTVFMDVLVSNTTTEGSYEDDESMTNPVVLTSKSIFLKLTNGS